MSAPTDSLSGLANEQIRPGSLGCHEAYHVASLLAETVEERLCQHPSIQMVPEWAALAARAAEVLHELYQAIGQKHMPVDGS